MSQQRRVYCGLLTLLLGSIGGISIALYLAMGAVSVPFESNTVGSILSIENCMIMSAGSWGSWTYGTIAVTFLKPNTTDQWINTSIEPPEGCWRGGNCCQRWVDEPLLFEVACGEGPDGVCLVLDMSDSPTYLNIMVLVVDIFLFVVSSVICLAFGVALCGPMIEAHRRKQRQVDPYAYVGLKAAYLDAEANSNPEQESHNQTEAPVQD